MNLFSTSQPSGIEEALQGVENRKIGEMNTLLVTYT